MIRAAAGQDHDLIVDIELIFEDHGQEVGIAHVLAVDLGDLIVEIDTIVAHEDHLLEVDLDLIVVDRAGS